MKDLIRKILREEKDLLATSAETLIRSLPTELKDLLFSQWDAKQNPKWHPEGNTLKHILVVIKRAYHHYPDDPNMIMAALFHDLGKMDTYAINPKTNLPTAYGHEKESVEYVEKFRDWIESFEGTDVEEIKYLVKNHMKVKPSTWDQMRDNKKEPIQSHPAFDKLQGFTDKLDGGGTNIAEQIRKILREDLGYWGVNGKNMGPKLEEESKGDKPYEEKVEEGYHVRTFSESVDEEELVWHRDREDRIVKSLGNTDWMIQMDNELPRPLTEMIYIPKNTYHRVIKGSGDLKVRINKL